MDDAVRQTLLAQQHSTTAFGKVVYEEGGLGTCGEATGEIMVTSLGVYVFPDPAVLIAEQHRVFIPVARIIRLEFEPAL